MAAIVLFYTPSCKTTKAIFDDYAGELSQDEYKFLRAKVLLSRVLTSPPLRCKYILNKKMKVT